MESITLNNGIQMPLIGYGTYQIPPSATERCVSEALACGYRAIDTAQCYNNEREVGLACRHCGLPRQELFITTKLWGCRGYEDAQRAIDVSLRTLALDHIDLLLIHEPSGNIHEIYRAMETAYKAGKVRAIGVSNFLEEHYLNLCNHCKIIPAVNQVETHVFRQQAKLRALEAQLGTRHESWSPLACGRNGIWQNPALVAIASAHGKSVAQVALRFLTQQGIAVIPKSTQPAHMCGNLASLDFDLDAEEMRTLKTLDTGQSLFGWW